MSSSKGRDRDEDDYGFDDESVISDISESSDTIQESFIEIYVYKVIYPGGTYVRISPDLKAEKTKTVLRFGEVFEASKSIVLDGINYVKLANNSGWVFARHHDKEVLELLNCIRKPINNMPARLHPAQTFSVDKILVDRRTTVKVKAAALTTEQKAKNTYWKDVRNKVMELKSFAEFESFSREIKLHPLIHTAGVVPAIESAESDEKVVIICKLICRIAAICRQCSHPNIVDGLEAAIWLFAHLGSHSRCAHALTLAVDASNSVFDDLDLDHQSEILSLVLEVSGSSRRFSAELSKIVNISETDIGNFLQRWMMLKITSAECQHGMSSNNSVGSASSGKSHHTDSSSSRLRSMRSRTSTENSTKGLNVHHTSRIPGTTSLTTDIHDDIYISSDRRRIIDSPSPAAVVDYIDPRIQRFPATEHKDHLSVSESKSYERPITTSTPPTKPEGFWRILSKELGFL